MSECEISDMLFSLLQIIEVSRGKEDLDSW